MFSPSFNSPAIEKMFQGNSFSGSDMRNVFSKSLGTAVADISSASKPSFRAPSRNDETFSQVPQEISTSSSASSIDGNILAFPSELGSENLNHYSKFEVYVVKTENMHLLGSSSHKVDELAIPRQATNIGGMASDFQKNLIKYTKLQEMIGLPLPDSLISDHSMSWSKSSGGMVSGIISLTDTLTDADSRERYKFMESAALAAGSTISNLASQFGAEGAETNLKLLTKRASNPRNEFLFDGVNNRSFNFQWKLIAKNKKESTAIKTILERFKLYMYPELDEATSGRFFIFPAIFDISFMSGNAENPYLYRASSCALTNMMINHNGGGMASFFEDGNAPFAYEVTMQFTELEFLHRARFLTDANPNGVAR